MTVNSGSKHQRRKDTNPDTRLCYFKETFLMLHCPDQRRVATTLHGAVLLFSQQLSREAKKVSLVRTRTDATVSCILPPMPLTRVCRSHCTLIIALLTFPHHPRSKIRLWIILWRTAEDNSKAQCWLFSTKKTLFILFICMSKYQNNLKTRRFTPGTYWVISKKY